MALVTAHEIGGKVGGEPAFSWSLAPTTGKPVMSITPTFLLRKVDPAKVLENYRAGKYAQYMLPEQKIAVPTVSASVQPTLGTSPEDDIFSFSST